MNLVKSIKDSLSITTVPFALALITIPSNILPRIDREPLNGLLSSFSTGFFFSSFTGNPIFLVIFSYQSYLVYYKLTNFLLLQLNFL
ncbi:uncharacterized protein METZ01_LOCUS102564 [marine metagenome]|uniref:Uncharacterized protein n=1 Tax=marine metagenome TaxID=408172 RepID=A0A381WB07_9ZZZZ